MSFVGDVVQRGPRHDHLSLMVVANGEYLHGTWYWPILPDSVHLEDFELSSGEMVKVEMMNFAVPVEQRIAQLTPIFTYMKFPKLYNTTDASSKIHGESLKGDLQKLGILDAFEIGLADFSGIDGQTNLNLNDILHRATLQWDDKSASGVAGSGGDVAVPPSFAAINSNEGDLGEDVGVFPTPPSIDLAYNRPAIFTNNAGHLKFKLQVILDIDGYICHEPNVLRKERYLICLLENLVANVAQIQVKVLGAKKVDAQLGGVIVPGNVNLAHEQIFAHHLRSQSPTTTTTSTSGVILQVDRQHRVKVPPAGDDDVPVDQLHLLGAEGHIGEAHRFPVQVLIPLLTRGLLQQNVLLANDSQHRDEVGRVSGLSLGPLGSSSSSSHCVGHVLLWSDLGSVHLVVLDLIVR
ncbi:hypothetical protein TYRP_018336 [Tyrophagus putrescentiae]|nr:hypothetical protein TYRP_018336 [Tyrophagus putrescentiae]